MYRFGDAITWFVIFYFIQIPPILPGLFQIIKMASTIRLKINKIMVNNADKTFEAGKITVMCFDKTGTITTNALKITSYFQIQNNSLV